VRPLVLVVEDEPPLQKLLAYNLEAAGFETAQAFDGEEAVTLVEERTPDLVILDWMLPQLSGIELCRRLRRRPETAHLPIIMLTARGEEHDRLRGLETGADDFVTKPFSPAELIARVRAVLRRVRPAFAEQVLTFHDLRVDLAAHRVFRSEREIHLSPTEFRLLRHFLEHPGRVFSRVQLLERVWGTDLDIELRTVDATVRRLRRALNAAGEADLLRTVRAEGYALDYKLAMVTAEGACPSAPPLGNSSEKPEGGAGARDTPAR
jgi:two-component system phosphate regulon response regulator PhoB